MDALEAFGGKKNHTGKCSLSLSKNNKLSIYEAFPAPRRRVHGLVPVLRDRVHRECLAVERLLVAARGRLAVAGAVAALKWYKNQACV